jgi:hypothetical protein
VQSLPASSTAFPRGANSFIVSSAEEKALSVLTGNSGALDGSIGFNVGDTPDSSGWKPVAVCEICHALGWITGDYNSDDSFPWVADLYRYSAPGRYQWIGGQPAYFSIDGGNTDLADFSTSFDYTLFPNVAANDPLRLPFESSARTLTSLDIEALSVIGFGVQSHASTVVSSPRNSYGGDVNDDGRSDILWQNADGQASIWR